MPGLEKIHLEDALDDSPQTRSLVTLFEQDAHLLENYIKSFYNHCEKILNAQKDLTSATRSLSNHLRTYEKQVFPLDTDPDSILKTTLRELASTLDEVSSWQQICVSQLSDGMMFPLNRFIEADLSEIFTMTELFYLSSNELEHAVSKFCKVPKKRDSEKQRQEANEEVYSTTKKFHQMALHYYANMNALQYKRKIALLEPLLGFLHALKSHFSVGHEALNTPELDNFLSNIGASIQGVNAELVEETKKTVDLIDTIELQSQHLYYGEPPEDMPYIPPNTGMLQKSGYLFMKTRFAGMMTKWERVYIYTLGCYLMSMSKDDVAGSVIMELDKTVASQALENEDRKYTFQIFNNKRAVILQALNERDRDEWIATVHNISKESFAFREHSDSVKHTSKEKPSKIPERPANSPSVSSNSSSKEIKEWKSIPSSSSMDMLPVTPIQFDLFSPADDKDRIKSQDGPSLRLNALDAMSSSKDVPFTEAFEVRFLGSMQVKIDRGEQLVCETIRQIMAARAIHNVFKTTESHMVITYQTLKVMDPSHNAVRASFPLEDISFWTTHKENNRLLGFITRSVSDSNSPPIFHCHVFEVQPSAEEVCNALSTAANIALKAILEFKEKDSSHQVPSTENLHPENESKANSEERSSKELPEACSAD